MFSQRHYNLTGYKFRNLNLKEGNQASKGIRAVKYIHFPIIQQEDYTKSLMYLAFRFSKHGFNQHLLSRAQVCGMWAKRPQEKLRQRFTIYRSRKKYTTNLEGGATWKVKAGTGREWPGLGHIPLWECFEVQGQGRTGQFKPGAGFWPVA